MSETDTKRRTDAEVAAGEAVLVEALNAGSISAHEAADGYWRSIVEAILDAAEGSRLGQAGEGS
jgi:hypothetical protein